ncbi:MAG: hypothetical protein M9927_01585 [Anaerolineae bacterium]|nr:hypothetical protein [Anaerolineae bacterium]
MDVPPEVRGDRPGHRRDHCVGLSGFLPGLRPDEGHRRHRSKAAGLDDVKIMIGGGQIDENIRQYTGADAYGRDAMAAVDLAKSWV